MLAPYVKRVYQKLSSKDLLDSCKEMGTQNADECFHNTVWSLCSKVIYTFIYNIIIYYYLDSCSIIHTDAKRLSGARKLRKGNKDNVERATSSYWYWKCKIVIF